MGSVSFGAQTNRLGNVLFASLTSCKSTRAEAESQARKQSITCSRCLGHNNMDFRGMVLILTAEGRPAGLSNEPALPAELLLTLFSLFFFSSSSRMWLILQCCSVATRAIIVCVKLERNGWLSLLQL